MAFFRTWVRKEAYLKAVGGGVPAGLRRFSVSVAPDEPPAILETELEDGGVSALSLYDIDVPEGYVGALAVKGTGHRISGTSMTWLRRWDRAEIGMNENDWIAACGLNCEACEIHRLPFDRAAADVCVAWYREMGWLTDRFARIDPATAPRRSDEEWRPRR